MASSLGCIRMAQVFQIETFKCYKCSDWNISRTVASSARTRMRYKIRKRSNCIRIFDLNAFNRKNPKAFWTTVREQFGAIVKLFLIAPKRVREIFLDAQVMKKLHEEPQSETFKTIRIDLGIINPIIDFNLPGIQADQTNFERISEGEQIISLAYRIWIP